MKVVNRSISVRYLLFILAISLITYLASCSGGSGNNTNTSTGGLPGDPGSLATENTVDLNAIAGIAPDDIEIDPTNGAEIAVTSFQIRLKPDATVGEVNNLLTFLNGEIVSMFEGAPFLLIKIPNPGGLAEYDRIISDVKAMPFVEYVSPGYFPATRELPANHDISSDYMAMIGHQLAVGAQGAWHVRYLADMSLLQPHLIIADAFGDGNPDTAYNISSTGASVFNRSDPQDHGYGVLGVILAKFGGNELNRGLQTGIYPGALSVTGIDITKLPTSNLSDPSELKGTFNMIEDLIIHNVKIQYGKPTIVNTSIGSPCSVNDLANTYCVASWARDEGFDWLQKVRLNGLENKFIHVTAAGNIEQGASNHTEAMYDSPFAAARLITDFEHDGALITPLTNVLAVESLVHSDNAPYEPVCLSNGSKYHGDIAAVGHWISSLTAPSNISGSRFYHGTSFSAPQVAGAAAYVWAIDPTLTADSVIDRINATTRPGVSVSAATSGCTTLLSARVLDTYRAVLSTDTDLSSPSLAPVRSELMDVADAAGAPGRNGIFDEQDLHLLHDIYTLQAGELDYSRYDLNGDGYTGGDKTSHFDLDLDAAFTIVSQTIGDTDISFSESNASDEDIMCYYAYSALYTGDTVSRDNIVGSTCGINECLYYETYNGPGEFHYIKSCWDPEPVIVTYEHSESSGFSNITVSQRLCNSAIPMYTINTECTGDNFDIYASVRYGYNSWVDESAIVLDIYYLNGAEVFTYYSCDDYGTLRHDNITDENQEFGSLENCHTALKEYIPSDPAVFDNPGDCHAWWDHGLIECQK